MPTVLKEGPEIVFVLNLRPIHFPESVMKSPCAFQLLDVFHLLLLPISPIISMNFGRLATGSLRQ
jgi:hypothetical protein